jgi:SnoaL-like domain
VLKARYADVCDTGYDPDRMRPLFTADAYWDGGERFGRYEGVDRSVASSRTCRARSPGRSTTWWRR